MDGFSGSWLGSYGVVPAAFQVSAGRGCLEVPKRDRPPAWLLGGSKFSHNSRRNFQLLPQPAVKMPKSLPPCANPTLYHSPPSPAWHHPTEPPGGLDSGGFGTLLGLRAHRREAERLQSFRGSASFVWLVSTAERFDDIGTFDRPVCLPFPAWLTSAP